MVDFLKDLEEKYNQGVATNYQLGQLGIHYVRNNLFGGKHLDRLREFAKKASRAFLVKQYITVDFDLKNLTHDFGHGFQAEITVQDDGFVTGELTYKPGIFSKRALIATDKIEKDNIASVFLWDYEDVLKFELHINQNF